DCADLVPITGDRGNARSCSFGKRDPDGPVQEGRFLFEEAPFKDSLRASDLGIGSELAATSIQFAEQSRLDSVERSGAARVWRRPRLKRDPTRLRSGDVTRYQPVGRQLPVYQSSIESASAAYSKERRQNFEGRPIWRVQPGSRELYAD